MRLNLNDDSEDNCSDFEELLEIVQGYSDSMSIDQMFIEFTRELQNQYPIQRGLLAIRRDDSTRFTATTTISEKKVRRNLSLTLPQVSSLFEKVAETGITFSEESTIFFSGNKFEQNLLLGENAASYVIIPLRHSGQVIAIIGYSSNQFAAFSLFEEGAFDRIATLFAAHIATAGLTEATY